MLKEANPVVVPGMILQLSGHDARVVKIVRDGVSVQIGNRVITVPFDKIEVSLKKQG